MADSERSPSRRTASDLHPADPADDLTGGTDAAAQAADPVPDDPIADDPVRDDPVPDGWMPGDTVPGDGSVGAAPAHGDVDAPRGVARGREADAARADVSDETPTPRDTSAG